MRTTNKATAVISRLCNRLCISAKTHPYGPPFADVAPLFTFGGKRVKKDFVLPFNPLCDEVGERVVQRSVDRVSRLLVSLHYALLQNPGVFQVKVRRMLS
jgi:hypothetical protein